jgi:hypothetical protein
LADRETPLLEEIRALVDAPRAGDEAPDRARIEQTLTDGYAHALQLDAERFRLERSIRETVASLRRENAEDEAHKLVVLSERATTTAGELAQLRSRLAVLQDRYRAASGHPTRG